MLKPKFALLLAILLISLQPLSATSVADGGEKHPCTPAPAPAHAPDLGERGPKENTDDLEKETPVVGSVTAAAVKAVPSSEQATPTASKPQKGSSHHAQDPGTRSPVFGILALVAGSLALLSFIGTSLSWIFLVLFLLMVPTAIVCGIIGMGKDRPKRGLAIAGFVMGLTVFTISLFAFALMLLAMF